MSFLMLHETAINSANINHSCIFALSERAPFKTYNYDIYFSF